MANDIYNYSVMTNTGKGFITHEDSRAFWIQGFLQMYGLLRCKRIKTLGARNNGVSKTKIKLKHL